MNYDEMIDIARQFYTDLSVNNTKDWWEANRARYDQKIKPAALALLEDIKPKLEALTGTPVKPKLFRPHRDVRFSKDKSPFRTHLHMMWQVQDTARQQPVFFFGVGPDYVTVGGGIMGFDRQVLLDWRHRVDLDAKIVADVVRQTESAGFALRDPELKRVPSPFPGDHPNARLLRMKSCVASKPLGLGRVPVAIMAGFRGLAPLNHLLLSVASD